jgi:hypothetical protein
VRHLAVSRAGCSRLRRWNADEFGDESGHLPTGSPCRAGGPNCEVSAR